MTRIIIQTCRCPNCNRWFNFSSIASCYISGDHNQAIYTDSFDEENPPQIAILECPHCATAYWKKNLPISSTYGCGEFRGKSPRASYINNEKISDLVGRNFWETRDEELALRMMMWWFLNMPNRKALNYVNISEVDGIFQENLVKLLSIIDCTTAHHAIMKAEILREIGMFRECIDWLDYLVLSNINDIKATGNVSAINTIMKYAKNNVAIVRKIEKLVCVNFD